MDEPGSPTYELLLDLELLCDEWDAIGIETGAIRNSLNEVGALATARMYGTGTHDEGMSAALAHFQDPDKTIEGLIVSRHSHLFSEEDRAAAQAKLDAAL